MKVTWQPNDIHAGQRLFKTAVSETWLIGYTAGTREGESGRWLIISLADGAVLHRYNTVNALLVDLNSEGDWLPEEVRPVVTFND